MELLSSRVRPLFAGLVIGLAVVLFGVMFWMAQQSTSRLSAEAEAAMQNAPKVKLLPKSLVYGDDKWTIIKTNEVNLNDWKMTLRMPYGYVKKTAYMRDKVEDAYYFADVDALRNSDCRERYYLQIKATRPGLKVQRINGFVTTIKIGGKDTPVEKYYAANVKPNTNYVVMPGDDGSWRRLYHVGEYYFYDLSELPSARLDTTAQKQRDLFCKQTRILDADEIFIAALATLEIKR